MAQQIRGIVFDLDGTLVDAEPLYKTAYNAVASEYGKVYDWQVIQHVIGLPEEIGAAKIIALLELPLTVAELFAKRDAHLDRLFRETLQPCAGALALLQHFRVTCGLPVAIATSSHRRHIALKRANNEALFALISNKADGSGAPAIVCGDDPRLGPGRGKPHGDIYELAAGDLGVPASACLAFEDSTTGFAAAVAAGMAAYAIPDRQPGDTRTAADLAAAYPGGAGILASLESFDPTRHGLPAPPPGWPAPLDAPAHALFVHASHTQKHRLVEYMAAGAAGGDGGGGDGGGTGGVGGGGAARFAAQSPQRSGARVLRFDAPSRAALDAAARRVLGDKFAHLAVDKLLVADAAAPSWAALLARANAAALALGAGAKLRLSCEPAALGRRLVASLDAGVVLEPRDGQFSHVLFVVEEPRAAPWTDPEAECPLAERGKGRKMAPGRKAKAKRRAAGGGAGGGAGAGGAAPPARYWWAVRREDFFLRQRLEVPAPRGLKDASSAVSRASHKIREAVETGRVAPCVAPAAPSGRARPLLAADIGASPGGWTDYLAGRDAAQIALAQADAASASADFDGGGGGGGAATGPGGASGGASR